MSRFASQGNLFAATQPEPEPEPEPIAELTALLRQLRAATVHPWTPLSEAVQIEYRVQALGQRGGPEGERLAAEVLAESERLFADAEAA